MLEEELFGRLARGQSVHLCDFKNTDQEKLCRLVRNWQAEKFLALKEDPQEIAATFYYEPLNTVAIQHDLSLEIRNHVPITIFFETHSTNEEAKFIDNKCGVILCERQSQGRGRHGKIWHSPLGRNIYCSFKLTFPREFLERLSSLSVHVGIILAKILQKEGINAKVKWPNDIWVNEKKLAGILIENHIQKNQIISIIGIGLNVHQWEMLDENNGLSTDTVTSYDQESSEIGDRNQLVGQLITALWRHYQAILHGQMIEIAEIWEQYSALIGRNVCLFSGEKKLLGREIGIDPDGAFLLLKENNDVECITIGELSLRPF